MIWISGEQQIKKYHDASGFNSHFCIHCGSPVPNKIRKSELYWIPVGLLEEAHSSQLVCHLFVSSKVEWVHRNQDVKYYSEMPELDDLLSILQSKDM